MEKSLFRKPPLIAKCNLIKRLSFSFLTFLYNKKRKIRRRERILRTTKQKRNASLLQSNQARENFRSLSAASLFSISRNFRTPTEELRLYPIGRSSDSVPHTPLCLLARRQCHRNEVLTAVGAVRFPTDFPFDPEPNEREPIKRCNYD